MVIHKNQGWLIPNLLDIGLAITFSILYYNKHEIPISSVDIMYNVLNAYFMEHYWLLKHQQPCFPRMLFHKQFMSPLDFCELFLCPLSLSILPSSHRKYVLFAE
jgi:hypothetical protein